MVENVIELSTYEAECLIRKLQKAVKDAEKKTVLGEGLGTLFFQPTVFRDGYAQPDFQTKYIVYVKPSPPIWEAK